MDKAFGSVRLEPAAEMDLKTLGQKLHSAIRRGDVDTTVQLLSLGADPNEATDELGATPLHTAAQLGRTLWSDEPVYGPDVGVRLLKELLERGAEANAVDKYGYSALHLAAATGNVDMVSVLLSRGANPSLQDTELFFTPLHVAIYNGRVDASLLLIEAGADTARTDYTGRSAWQVFAAAPNPPPKSASSAKSVDATAAAGAGQVAEGGGAGCCLGPAGPAATPQPDGPTSMLQLLLAGLRDGRSIPVSAVFSLVLEITGSSGGDGAEKGGATNPAAAPAAATSGPVTAGSAWTAVGSSGSVTIQPPESGSVTVVTLVRQLVVTIRDLGDTEGCWQLLAEAVRFGAAGVAALVVEAVVELHPASLAVLPWGQSLVDVIAVMPEVFDQLVTRELGRAPSEHVVAVVRGLHPSRLDPSTRLLLYHRLVAALRRGPGRGQGRGQPTASASEDPTVPHPAGAVAGAGGDAVRSPGWDKGLEGDPEPDPRVARAFLEELQPDTVADLATTPFFQAFTGLLPVSVRVQAEAAAAAASCAPPPGSQCWGGDAGGMSDVVLQSRATGPLDTFVVTHLLQGAMQSRSLRAVDLVVRSVLHWQHAANAAGRRALLLGLNAQLLDDLATCFPTSFRALMQMPRQRGQGMHVRLPRSFGTGTGKPLYRCSATPAHHLVWWPRMARVLTSGPLTAVGPLTEVEALLEAGLPLESLWAVVEGRNGRQGRAAGEKAGGGGFALPGILSTAARALGTSKAWRVGQQRQGTLRGAWPGNAVVPDGGTATTGGQQLSGKHGPPREAATAAAGPAGGGDGPRRSSITAASGALPAGARYFSEEEGEGEGEAAEEDSNSSIASEGSATAVSSWAAGRSEVAHMRELMARGLTAAHINSLVCSGTALASVVAAADEGVPLSCVAELLDAGLGFQVVEALVHRPVHQSTRYWKLRPHNELFFKLPFASWHKGITHAFFGPFLTQWARNGWRRDFIDCLFHANDPLAARLKAAYDHRGVPQRLPPALQAAHDPRLQDTAQRRLLLLRVFLAAWWLPQRLATAALLAVGWGVELGARWLLQQGPRPLRSALRGLMRPLGAGEEQLTPHDAVAEMLPVHGITRIGRAGLLQALIKAAVPSAEYGLELPRAVVMVHWEGYARALYAMQGLEHVLLMALYGIFLWAVRTELDDAMGPPQLQQQLASSPPTDTASDNSPPAQADTADGGGGGAGWPLRSSRLGLPLLLLFWAAAAGLVLEGWRARVNGLVAYRAHQANWVRVASGCLTIAAVALLLAGSREGGGGDGSAWRHALRMALAIGSVQVLLLCYLLLLFSSLSDGMGGLVRMVVAVVNSMGYFFLVLALVLGGFLAAFLVLMDASLELTPFALRLFTVLLGDFSNNDLKVMLDDDTSSNSFIVPALGVVLMSAYGVLIIIILINLLIAIMTDAYAKVRASEAAEVARNQAYIINDLQLALPQRVAEQLETALLGPYLHLLTVTAVDSAGVMRA